MKEVLNSNCFRATEVKGSLAVVRKEITATTAKADDLKVIRVAVLEWLRAAKKGMGTHRVQLAKVDDVVQAVSNIMKL